MSAYTLSSVSDPQLIRDLATYVARGWANTAIVLAHIAEVDARRLYRAEGHPSMFSYCVCALHFSDDAAYKRIQAARAARQFPAIFHAVAEGRLHLTAVNLLAPHLVAENVDELLAATTHQTKSQIELLLAERFPRPDAPTLVQPLASAPSLPTTSSRPDAGTSLGQLAPAQAEQVTRDKVAPLSAERVLLQATIDRRTHDKLRHAQALLGHQVPSGDIAEVLDRALDALIVKLERRKFAATDAPRAHRGASRASRHVPAHVKRAVWERDDGQCTFVGNSGTRCPARTRLEFDHVLEVARGGRATVEGIRLRCRAHNQYAAECTFGVEFMKHKRHEARRARAATRPSIATRTTAAVGTPGSPLARLAPGPVPGTASSVPENDVVPWLRRLGFRVDEARRAAAFCAGISDASLDDRVRAALCFLRPGVPSRGRHREPGKHRDDHHLPETLA